jgi:hypothetical protein
MSSVDAEIWRLAASQHGVVSLAQLRALGVSDAQIKRRVADRRLHRVHRGVYAVGHAILTTRGRWLAAVLALGPAAVLSHTDAAALWDLTAPRRTWTHVTVPGGSRARRPGIVVHGTRMLHPADRVTLARIPVTALARTLLDLAELVPSTQLQRAYERAARLGVLDIGAIEALLGRSNGRRGSRPLRKLLAYDPTPASEAVSELERLFVDVMRHGGVPAPLVNVLVEGYVVDAYWPASRLVVELDGHAYHGDRDAFERDHARSVRLRLAGYEVLRFTYLQVTRQSLLVVAAVRDALARGQHATRSKATRR